jgi:hypothetical protein
MASADRYKRREAMVTDFWRAWEYVVVELHQ